MKTNEVEGALFAQLVECQTLDGKVAGSDLTRGTVLSTCVLEQDASSLLLNTGSKFFNILIL